MCGADCEAIFYHSSYYFSSDCFSKFCKQRTYYFIKVIFINTVIVKQLKRVDRRRDTNRQSSIYIFSTPGQFRTVPTPRALLVEYLWIIFVYLYVGFSGGQPPLCLSMTRLCNNVIIMSNIFLSRLFPTQTYACFLLNKIIGA